MLSDFHKSTAAMMGCKTDQKSVVGDLQRFLDFFKHGTDYSRPDLPWSVPCLVLGGFETVLNDQSGCICYKDCSVDQILEGLEIFRTSTQNLLNYGVMPHHK